VHESIPANMDLACDMHGRYDAVTGKQVAKALEPLHCQAGPFLKL